MLMLPLLTQQLRASAALLPLLRQASLGPSNSQIGLMSNMHPTITDLQLVLPSQNSMQSQVVLML